jgi:hypothetical protein
MLLRWIIQRFCRTRAEIRIVLRALRHHYEYRNEHDPVMTHASRQPDKRITRSVRLSLLCGLLMLYVESPRLFAIAPMVVPLAALLVLFRVIGVLH